MRRILVPLGALCVVVAIVFGALHYLREQRVAEPGAPQVTNDAAPALPRQPEWCPDFEFLAIPGTAETSPTDDPYNPTFNPYQFLGAVTRPLQQQYAADHVRVFTVPYVAQIRDLAHPQYATYDESKAAGRARAEQEMRELHASCPLTRFIVSGFSQGATIAGDLMSDIGQGRGPVPPEVIAGAAIVADPRREPGTALEPSNPVAGHGIELALAPFNNLVGAVTPGATMSGPRPGGFGVLRDRVHQICAPDDIICDAPRDPADVLAKTPSFFSANVVHMQYGENRGVIPGGVLVADWILGWARGIIR